MFAQGGHRKAERPLGSDVAETAAAILGGRLMAEGTPEAVAKVKASHTGRALARYFAELRAGEAR
jgi:hypothetical protein